MRSPDKQRYLKAVRHERAAEAALFELEADPAVAQAMLGRPVDFALHSFELPIADVVEWNRRMGNDMVYFSHVWHLGRREAADEAGRRHYVDGTMKTRASLRALTLPDLGALRRRLEELLAAIEGTGFGLIVGAQTAGFTVPTAIGYQDFCLAVVETPAFVSDFQARVHEYAMRELEMVLEYPVDGVKIGSGLIGNAGAMLGPEMMERFEFRFMREQAARVKAAGRVLMFHVDGAVDGVLPALLAMGADVLHPIDPCGGSQDIRRVKALWGGRVALHGNLDVNGVLLHGSPGEVAAAVRAAISDLSAGGGYVVGSSHDLHERIPVANVYAMRDAVHGFGTT